jgi:hypothetical protein
MTCRLIVTLRITDDGPDVDAVYEDVGELDAGSRAGLKALYSDARKRAAVAAGIGAYLYTALAPVVLPIGPRDRQVQLIRRSGKPDTLALSAATEQWLRDGYEQRIGTEAVKRDLGEILAHGEPERGMGQGEATEQPPGSPRRGGGARDRRAGPEQQRRGARSPTWKRRRGRRLERPGPRGRVTTRKRREDHP